MWWLGRKASSIWWAAIFPLLTPKGFLVVKHDANFNELWRKTYAQGYFAHRAAVDGLGNLVAVGRAQGLVANWMSIKLDPSWYLLGLHASWTRCLRPMNTPARWPSGPTTRST